MPSHAVERLANAVRNDWRGMAGVRGGEEQSEARTTRRNDSNGEARARGGRPGGVPWEEQWVAAPARWHSPPHRRVRVHGGGVVRDAYEACDRRAHRADHVRVARGGCSRKRTFTLAHGGGVAMIFREMQSMQPPIC